MSKIPKGIPMLSFSTREQRAEYVKRRVAEGGSAKNIALELGVHQNTVYTLLRGPRERISGMPTFTLYRLYAAGDRLLYIGQTTDWPSRFKHHARCSEWFPEVRAVRLDCEYDSVDELRFAEAMAIIHEGPLHNKALC
jgi:hypothetical protein